MLNKYFRRYKKVFQKNKYQWLSKAHILQPNLTIINLIAFPSISLIEISKLCSLIIITSELHIRTRVKLHVHFVFNDDTREKEKKNKQNIRNGIATVTVNALLSL